MLAAHTPTAQDPPPEPATVSVKDAARELGCTEKQVRLALLRDSLGGFKPGGLKMSRWRVLRASLDALKGAVGPEAPDPAAAPGLARFRRLRAELVLLLERVEDELAGQAR